GLSQAPVRAARGRLSVDRAGNGAPPRPRATGPYPSLSVPPTEDPGGEHRSSRSPGTVATLVRSALVHRKRPARGRAPAPTRARSAPVQRRERTVAAPPRALLRPDLLAARQSPRTRRPDEHGGLDRGADAVHGHRTRRPGRHFPRFGETEGLHAE